MAGEGWIGAYTRHSGAVLSGCAVSEDVYVLNDCGGGLRVAGCGAQRDPRRYMARRAAWEAVDDQNEEALRRIAQSGCRYILKSG